MKLRTLSTVTCVLLAAAMLTGCASRVDQLSDKLQSPDSMTRWDAAEELGQTQNPQAVKPLIGAMDDPAPEVSNAAAESLAEIGQPSVDALITKLSSEAVQTRQTAMFSLGLIGGKKAEKAIATMLDDENTDVRYEAAAILQQIGTPDTSETLQAAMKQEKNDKVKSMMDSAIKAIEQREEMRQKKLEEQRKKQAEAQKRAEAAKKAAAERKKKELEAQKKAQQQKKEQAQGERLDKIKEKYEKTWKPGENPEEQASSDEK